MAADHMTFAELADRLGHGPDWLRRHVDRLIVEEGMPPPVCPIGRRKWVRDKIEPWLGGYRFARPANDDTPFDDAIGAARAALAAVYGAVR